MDAELQKRMLEYLDTLEGTVKAGADFAADQVPLLAQEWLAWCFWSSVLGAAASIVVCLILGFTCWMLGRVKDPNEGHVVAFIICCGLAVLLFIPAAACTVQAVKVKVAPRVVLLEKISELAKGRP